MDSSVIHISFTINDRYTKFLSVTLASILASADEDDDFSFYILSDYITDENKRKLEQLKIIKDFDLHHIKIDSENYKNLPGSPQVHILISSLYRIEVPSIFPDLDKVLFLDAGDLCVLKSLSEIWNMDIGNNYMACVPDQQPYLYGDYVLALPFDRSKRYFNTGVQLIDLKKWRNDGIEKKIFNGIVKYRNLVELPEQDMMNIVLRDKIFSLSHKWNAMPWQIYALESEKEEAFKDPCIMHWAGPQKPWIFHDAKYSDVFFKYARMTPFYEEILFENFRFGDLYYRSDKLRSDFEVGKAGSFSHSYRIGRIITWFPRKVRRFILCCKQHGFSYTIKHFIKKCIRKISIRK
jgi:lipopolysaccharide biosynthesis glycosyltransferase